MKYFIIILFVVQSAHAQEKGDNTILIPGITFRFAMLQCLDNGYNIALKDDTLQFFNTTPQTDKHSNIYILHVRIKDTVMILTGELNPNINISMGMISSTTPMAKIECKGMKGSPLKQSWDDMNEFALSFGKPVTYTKK